MTAWSVSPFAAPGLLFGSAAILAVLPAPAGRAAALLLPASGVLALALAVTGTRGGSPFAAVDPLARLLFVLAAAIVAALGVLSVAAAVRPLASIGGPRLRLARAGLPAAGGAALLTPVLAEVASSLGALALLALVCAALVAIVHGEAAARDALRRIVLAGVAASLGFAGLLLVAAGTAQTGALVLLLAAGALGAVPILASGRPQAAFALPPALAGAVLLLPPVAAASPLLRARAALPAGSAAARIADAALLLAGLAVLATGAATRWRARTPADAASREIAALSGPALFGWGLGTVSGLQAGFAALLFAALAGIARLEATHRAARAPRVAAALATAHLPPFGSFAAALLLAEATLPTRPLLGALFLLLLAAFSLAVLAPLPAAPLDQAVPRRAPILLAGVLALSVVGGVAMPARIAGALVDAAGLVAGGGR